MNHIHIQGLSYHIRTQNNQESLLTIGNGQFGLRGTYEEKMPYESRGLFCAGLFGTEHGQKEALINLPDPSHLRITVNNHQFHALESHVLKENRYLDPISMELCRDILFEDQDHYRYQLTFKRMFSTKNFSILYQKIEITSLDIDTTIEIEASIEGDKNGAGFSLIKNTQFSVKDKMFMNAKYHYEHASFNDVTYTMGVIDQNVWLSGKFIPIKKGIIGLFETNLVKGVTKTIEKRCMIIEDSFYPHPHMILMNTLPYDTVYEENRTNSQSQRHLIDLKSKGHIQEKIYGSIYHANIMTPVTSNKSIGAKGLSGEGYSGHIFWDTEIFMLPTFLWTKPNHAKKLLMYRYMRLNAAKEHAKNQGFDGAQVPWESAHTGLDQTPTHSAFNIHTGQQTKIYSGLKELHVTADVMYAILMYYAHTKDLTFMENEGRAMLEAYAKFWISRTKLTSRGYEILDVIGPDEYTEHVDNNFYTNYLVKKCLEASTLWIDDIKLKEKMIVVSQNMYLPQVIDDLIPQDDTFLSKGKIPLAAYRRKAGSQAILHDYSREEVINLQVLKQADLIMLFELFPYDFSEEVKKTCFNYYEPLTIHDSSLSKGTHAIVAYQIKHLDVAESYFLDALEIDFSTESHSKQGIHAASMFRPFQILIKGILGLYVSIDGHLYIKPQKQHLLESFTIKVIFRQIEIEIKYTQKEVHLLTTDDQDLIIIHQGQRLNLEKHLVIEL